MNALGIMGEPNCSILQSHTSLDFVSTKNILTSSRALV